MDKVRLDFYRELGGELSIGDCVLCVNGEVVMMESDDDVPVFNAPHHTDSQRFITSFAGRENKGVQPVPNGFPVVAIHSVGECSIPPEEMIWSDCGTRTITSWKPDYNKLLEMQKEHDAKQEKPIEELMINAKESKMSNVFTKEMKDRGELPKVGMKCLFQLKHWSCYNWKISIVKFVGETYIILDQNGVEYCVDYVNCDAGRKPVFKPFKPREFQKGHWYPCTVKEDNLSYPMIYNDGIFCDFIGSDIGYEERELIVGKSLGEIKFGGEE